VTLFVALLLGVGVVVALACLGHQDENGHSWMLAGSDDHHFTCAHCGCIDPSSDAKKPCGTDKERHEATK
jgi:hypothetical protein